MQERFQQSPGETRQMNTGQLREHFLVSDLWKRDEIGLLLTHYDRLVIGGAMPATKPLDLPTPDALKATHFLERREMGIINVGDPGEVEANGQKFGLEKLDCLYLGRGSSGVRFLPGNAGAEGPVFYFLSAPAHHTYPVTRMRKSEAAPVKLGSFATSNQRTIYKYIHLEGIKSCQLVMGLTILDPGSVWNSVPPHTHTRRMEAYFYFDLPDGHRIFHFMGEPAQTRHLALANHEAVVSPPWSVHFGCGTSNYGFIWGMAGENQEFSDMDQVSIPELL
jgi:4-deoxy-L-threo-5-hexosulose-uronate ketol-isomerase